MTTDGLPRPFRHVILGVTGAVDCMNSPGLITVLRRLTTRLSVVLTPAAARFMPASSLRVISDTQVMTDSDEDWHNHMRVAESADLFLVAPASANSIAKMAHGIADNLLTTIAISGCEPIVVAPSMSAPMWNNRRVKANCIALQESGVSVIPPTFGTEVSSLAEQFGAMPKPQELIHFVLALRRANETAAFRAYQAPETPKTKRSSRCRKEQLA